MSVSFASRVRIRPGAGLRPAKPAVGQTVRLVPALGVSTWKLEWPRSLKVCLAVFGVVKMTWNLAQEI